MANYQVEIDGGFTLTQINSAIAGEEAGASEPRRYTLPT